jgi:hypothetical protein
MDDAHILHLKRAGVVLVKDTLQDVDDFSIKLVFYS